MTRFSLILIFQIAPIGLGQDDPPDARDDSPADPGVTYLDISFEAEESLERARLLEAEGRWADAAKLLQLTGRRFGSHVVNVSPGQYRSIRDEVNRRVANWPREGLDAYRAAFESTAAAALDAVRDSRRPLEALRVADDYFPTHAGAEALDLAAQLLIERGDFEQARSAYRRLIDQHPDRAKRVHWRAKAAVAGALAGDLVDLEYELESRSDPDPPVDVNWTGRVQSVAAFLRERLAEFAPQQADLLTRATPPTIPRLLGGANHRRGNYPPSSAPEARLWKFEFPGAVTHERSGEHIFSDPTLAETLARALQSGKLLNGIPVVGDGLIYIHDGRRVWAIDPANRSRPAWTLGDDSAVIMPLWLHDDTIAPLHTALYRDGRLYLNLQIEGAGRGEDPDRGAHRQGIVCINAGNGEVRWRNDLADFHSQFEEAEVDGPPILHNGDLYVVGRRRKSFGFEACYLLRLDPGDGRLKSMIHLAEAATGSYGYRRATISLPAAAGDFVFVQTNLGAIAAVSTALDRVAWIHTYGVADDSGDQLWPERGGRPIRSWNYQPVMVWKDTIVCMPLDTTDVFILGQEDGRVRDRIPGERLTIPQTLLGIDEDRLYAVGGEVICYNLASQSVEWQRPLHVGQLLGRGCLTADRLLIPTDRALLSYPIDGGPPVVHAWRLHEVGNIVPQADQVLVHAAGMIYGLADRDEAFARLTRRAEQSPDDPMPAMALAELAFHSGQIDRGLEAVNDAVQRAGGFARLTDEAARQLIFDQLVQLAHSLESKERVGRTKADEESRNATARMMGAISLLRMAGQCAPSSEDLVRQRFRLASALTSVGRHAEAVDSYQRVLADPSLRRLSVRLVATPAMIEPTGDLRSAEAAEMRFVNSVDPVIAGPAASRAIDDLIEAHGRKVYAAVEVKAGDRLKIAVADEDPAAIIEVAESFPNSAVATTAYAAHAELLCNRGELDAAARSFRRALAERDCPSRAIVIRNYIECLLQDGRKKDAAQWLDRAERDYPRLEFTRDGRSLAIAEYRRAVLGDEQFVDPRHAIQVAAANNHYTRVFPDKVTILDPTFDHLPHTSWDTMLVAAAGQVDARHPVTGRGLWPRSVASRSQPSLLGMDASRFILSTPWRVIAVTRTSGQVSWEFGQEPPDDPMVEPENTSPWTHQVLLPERLYCASDRGEIVCIELSDGALRWSHRADSSLAGPIAADEKFVCFPTWQGSELVVSVLDALNGDTLRTIRPPDAWPMQSMRLTRKNRLLLIRTTSIQCLNPDTGDTDWLVTAPDHFVLSTVQLDSDALFVSPDGRRVSRYNLDDGRLVWRSPVVGKAAEQGIWAGLSRGALYVAGPDRIEAFDSADGHPLWSARTPGCLAIQAPRITADAVVTVNVEDRRRLPKSVEEKVGDQRVYVVRRYSLETGAPLDVADDGPLASQPIASFGGMHLRDKAILLLDGSLLIGYVDGKPD